MMTMISNEKVGRVEGGWVREEIRRNERVGRRQGISMERVEGNEDGGEDQAGGPRHQGAEEEGAEDRYYLEAVSTISTLTVGVGLGQGRGCEAPPGV